MTPSPARTGRSPRLVLLVAAALAVGPWLLAAPHARAATPFVVDRTTNEADRNPDDGRCDSTPAADGDQCTLRAAIQQANATPGADTIRFNIPGPGVQTIAPTGTLPLVTDPVTIDGYSQPGSRPNTLAVGTNAVLQIELDGSLATTRAPLRLDAPNSVVRGLVINRFRDSAISLDYEAGGSRIEGCFLGTNAAGTADLGHSQSGVNSLTRVVVGGAAPAARNLISGNQGDGVTLSGGRGGRSGATEMC